jgi:low temperature requirement protein LtrA
MITSPSQLNESGRLYQGNHEGYGGMSVTSSHGGAGMLRAQRGGGGRVTFLELFFDLVFVFAVTQLSHLLLTHLTGHGAIQTLLLLLAVWWAWIDTAWITNWFDPNHRAMRLVLVAVMFGSLIMSAAIPEAFGARGLYFAGAYAAIQVGRNAFAVAALGSQPGLRRNFARILSWKLVSGALWVAGGFAHDGSREALWLAAVIFEYAAPAAGFYTPGLGRSTVSDWTISGGHLAERCQLFLIIALGESILVIGGTFGEVAFSAARLAALLVAFLGSVALWWIYFDRSADAGGEVIEHADDPGRLGRSAYTYGHLPMVAGIIVAAVGNELVIAHPTGHTGAATVATTIGGPALFLAGHLLFKRAVFGRVSISRLAALAALAALASVGTAPPPLLLAGAVTLVLAAVASWDLVILRRDASTTSRVVPAG